ncbi:MAG: HNH endonuclease family protein [bacterium]|nr:HNH endonuclease family protein [bacterium]
MLLLAVAFAAIIVAAVVFAGPPTDTEPAAVAAVIADAATPQGRDGGSTPRPNPASSPPPAAADTAPDGGRVPQPVLAAPQDTAGAAPSSVASPGPQADAGAAVAQSEAADTAPILDTAALPDGSEPASPANTPPPVAPPSTVTALPAPPPPAAATPPAPSPAVAAPPTPPATQAATASAPPAPETAASAPSAPPAAATEPAPENAAPAAEAAAPSREDGTPRAGSATLLVDQLRPLIAEPRADIPAYDRDHFAGWLDGDGDCVNTRHEVLQLEAAAFAMAQSGCSVASGEWFDPYTARTYTNPRDLDVDHVVALADAWVSGAYAWADELLDRFSNDLGNLNAIAAGENRSKSARGPADYTPSAPGARCDYLVQYATVKIRWQLSITPADFAATERGLAGCDAGTAQVSPVVPPAAQRPAGSSTPTTAVATPTGCHPAYSPCLPNLPGNALNCGDLTRDQKPVTVLVPGEDPYRLDGDGDGRGCTS